MKKFTHRFSALCNSERSLAVIDREKVLESLRGVAAWMDSAAVAAKTPGKCCRNALYHEDGSVTWMYPNSNTAEVISAWIDLSEALEESDMLARAVSYADTMLKDPVRGIYGDPAHPEAHGLPWYWTDGGTYGAIYAMRIPVHFKRLYDITGDERYRSACEQVGRMMLARQLDSGIVSAAWDPAIGWMHEVRIGSRTLYGVATFALLNQMTGEPAFAQGYEKSVDALLAMQNPDGSYFQMHDPRTRSEIDSSIKMHFCSYLLNGMRVAYEITNDSRLVECAKRLADHLAGVFYYRHAVPYCTGVVGEPADQTEAESSIQDACDGLQWLAEVTGEPVYWDVALKLWTEAWLHQMPLDRSSGWAGAILRGIKPDQSETPAGVPENRLHLHYAPSSIARSDLWFAVNHVAASRRLLSWLDSAVASSLDAGVDTQPFLYAKK